MPAVAVVLCLSFPGVGEEAPRPSGGVPCGAGGPVCPPWLSGCGCWGTGGAVTPPQAGLSRGFVPLGRCGVFDVVLAVVRDPPPRSPHWGNSTVGGRQARPPHLRRSVPPSVRLSSPPSVRHTRASCPPSGRFPRVLLSPPPASLCLPACTHLGTAGCVGSTCRARGWQLGDSARGDRQQLTLSPPGACVTPTRLCAGGRNRGTERGGTP